MRFTGSRFMLFGAFVLLLACALAGCTNPFDPVGKSDKIIGLTYIDFSATWDRWDSDPEYDGMLMTINYYNEFGETLTFRDKDNNVTIEFYSQKEVTIGEDTTITYDGSPFYTKTLSHDSSADSIRIPVEDYFCFDWADEEHLTKTAKNCDSASGPGLAAAYSVDSAGVSTPFDPTADFNAFIIIKVHPPQASPQAELKVGMSGNIIYKPTVTDVTPNP